MLLFTAFLSAQQQTPPVFRGGITIVPLHVTVLDKNGAPVADLKQSDFTIIEDGVRQDIKAFYAEVLKPGEIPAALAADAAHRPAPFGDASPPTHRTFLLVLGYGRIQVPIKAVDGALDFIRERLLPQDRVAVMAFNRATNFLTDHELVAATVERFKSAHEQIVSEINEFYGFIYHRGYPLPAEIQKGIDDIFLTGATPNAGMKSAASFLNGSSMFVADRKTAVAKYAPDPHEEPLEARTVLQDLLKFYAGTEYLRYETGDKHLIWIAHGLTEDLSGGHWTVQEDEKLARRANDAGVVADIIHVGGTGGFATQSSEYIAELTGGQFTGVSYADAALNRIDAASRVGYTLGYTPKNPALDDKYRKLSVKVTRPGLTVLFRHGYTATTDVQPLDLRDALTTSRLASAGTAEEDSHDIKIQATASTVAGLGARRVVVDLMIDVARVTFSSDQTRHMAGLDVRVFCGNDKNVVIGSAYENIDIDVSEAEYRRALKDGIRYSVRVPIEGDAKSVKVIVYDFRADLLGTATVKLK